MDRKEIDEILTIISEWKDAAKRENSYFAKFALEFAFNSLLRIVFSTDDRREQDRMLIERFKGWIRCKNLD